MKPQPIYVLNEVKKLEDNLWEVWTQTHYDNDTYVTTNVSHHSSQQEAENQRTINKFKTIGK